MPVALSIHPVLFHSTVTESEKTVLSAISSSFRSPSNFKFYPEILDIRVNDTTNPILVDSFEYCEETKLTVDVIFNLKYVTNGTRARILSRADCFAEMNDERTFNTIPFDPTTNEKATSFSFNHSCLKPPYDVIIHCDYVSQSYQITPAFIKRDRNKYYLSACTSLLDVDPLMVRRWILFNLANGVEHITFYINGNLQLWKDTLREYLKVGLVDMISFSYAFSKRFHEQACALNSCNRRYRGLSKWVIFNDVDEFFIPLNSSQRFIDIIRMYDHKHPGAAALVVIFLSFDVI